jgi:hypothetical protein
MFLCILPVYLGASYVFFNKILLLIKKKNISHMLFANDTVTMCDADVDQIHNLDHILMCFEAISGLKVNLQKSKLVQWGRSHSLKGWQTSSVVISLLFCCVTWVFLLVLP